MPEKGREVKILLVEDNEANLYLMQFILQKLRKLEINIAVDGKAAVELAHKLNPDIILMDIQLPVLDGYEAVKKIRHIDSLKSIPIVAITSYAMANDRKKCLTQGFSHYMEKPIDPEVFISLISKLVGDELS